MSTEKSFSFDPNINPLNQIVLANHLINEIVKEGKQTYNICPFSLAINLCNLKPRFSKTALDIILEYDLVNPQTIKTMGGENSAPYNGIFDSINSVLQFELLDLPESLVVILHRFCFLSSGNNNSINNGQIKERLSHMNLKFVLIEVNLKDAYTRIKPIEKLVQPSGKNGYNILIPGKPRIINNSGSSIRYISRGEYCNMNGSPYDTDSGKPCWWHRHPFEGKAIGIPVRVTISEGRLKIYMDGIFCSYECAYSYLNEELKKYYPYRDNIYENSEKLLKQLYHEQYPEKSLRCAPDWKSLKDVGNGDLSVREFIEKLSSYELTETPNYDTVPVVRYYELLKKK